MPPATLFSKVPIIPGLGQHKVIQMQAAWHWTQFFSTLNVRMMGHTNTKAKKDANETAVHVFRFVLRKDITTYCFSEAPVKNEVETAWPDIAEHPDDVILMTKLYMASTSLSQPPIVFCPAVFLKKLNIKDLEMANSAVLSARQKKELGKSATYFDGPPLNLHKAAEYLRSLINCDGSPQGTPEPCPWIFDDAKVIHFETITDDDDDPSLAAAASAAQPSAARVSAGPGPRKRPASAAAEAAAAAPSVPEASAGAPESAMDGLAPPGSGVPAADPADAGRGSGRGRGGRGRGKAKAKADAGRGKGRGRGGAFNFPPLKPGQQLGCSKCRGLPNGCGDCRRQLGWKQVGSKHWVIDSDADA